MYLMWTFLFLAFIAAGVDSAEMDLGQLCNSTLDTCVHPNILLVCDRTSGACAIQHGQSCHPAGYENHCVTGAVCLQTGVASYACTCKPSVYSPATDGSCVAATGRWGTMCKSNNNCRTGLYCDTIFGVCDCLSGKVANVSTGFCTDIPTQRVGYPCTSANAASACGTTSTTGLQCARNSLYSSSRSCQCTTGTTGTEGTACAAIGSGLVGHACGSCGSASTHLVCDQGSCKCEDGYHGVTGGQCYPAAGNLRGGCSSRCYVDDTVCTGTSAVKSCQCQIGFNTGNDGCDIPKNTVGGACTVGSCEDANAYCGLSILGLEGTCACNYGFSGVDGGGCENSSSLVGASVMSLLLAALLCIATMM